MSYVYFEVWRQEIYNGHILYSHFVSDAILSFDANFMKHPCVIVSFYNGMVIGDSSSRGQASELLVVLTARPRHDANLPGIFGALRPTTKRPMRNEMRGRGKKEEYEGKRKKWKGPRVFLRDVQRET